MLVHSESSRLRNLDHLSSAVGPCRCCSSSTLPRVQSRPPGRGTTGALRRAPGTSKRLMSSAALGVDTSAWLEMSVHNASLTVIRVEADGRFKVLAVGDSGHLPPMMHTGATGDPERGLEVPTD